MDSGILWVHLTHQFQSHHNVELTHYSLKYFNETTNPRTCKNIYNPRNFAPTNSTDLTVHSALQKSIQVNICHTMLKKQIIKMIRDILRLRYNNFEFNSFSAFVTLTERISTKVR